MGKTIGIEAANLAMDMALYIFIQQNRDLYNNSIMDISEFHDMAEKWAKSTFQNFCQFKEIDKVEVS